MQKLLNTHPFFLPSLARGIRQQLSAGRSGFVAALVLLLSVLSISSAVAGDFESNVVIVTGSKSGSPIAPRRFYTPTRGPGNSGVTVPFTINNPLGTFNRTATRLDELYLNAESNTIAGAGETVTPPSLYYRVYRRDSTGQIGGFIPLQLDKLVSGLPDGTAKWTSSNVSLNLIQYASAPGDYIVEIYFQAPFTRVDAPGTAPVPGNFFDGSQFAPYSNTFEQLVEGQLYVQDTWVPNTAPGATFNWFDPANWRSRTVPNSNTDISVFRNTNGVYPTIESGDARVHSLTLNGINPQQKAGFFLNGGTLSISGNFQDAWGGFKQKPASFLVLNGTTDQSFDGYSRTTAPFILDNLAIAGAGAKILTANLFINRSLVFDKDYFGNPSGSLVTGNFSVNLRETGVLAGETSGGYIEGTVISTRTVGNQQTENFGNIGVSITTKGVAPGSVTVTRDNYVYNGINTSQSIKRSFTFKADNGDIPQFDLEFNYLDIDLNGIPVSNLKLFRSETSDIPFESLGTSNSTVKNVFVRNNLSGNLNALYTLGDAANPLPVTLVSFTAALNAQGAALLRWTTANESNNKGFGIERQLAVGDVWQPVDFLATGNNAQGGIYTYTDKSLATATATPQAYYRLRQEDQDGKISYSPVAVVARPAVAASTNLVLSPVPVSGASISLTFAEASQAGSQVSITNVQGQRLLSYTTQASSETSLSLPVEKLAPGVYIVSVQVPGQALRYARFVKI